MESLEVDGHRQVDDAQDSQRCAPAGRRRDTARGRTRLAIIGRKDPFTEAARQTPEEVIAAIDETWEDGMAAAVDGMAGFPVGEFRGLTDSDDPLAYDGDTPRLDDPAVIVHGDHSTIQE